MTANTQPDGQDRSAQQGSQHQTPDPRTGRASEKGPREPREGSRPDGTSRVEREFERDGREGSSD